MRILVTGCAGYIGGTFTFEALKRGFKVIGIDSFIHGKKNNITFFLENYRESFKFIEEDLSDYKAEKLKKELDSIKIDVAVHCAGLKSVDESEKEPLLYWKNNVDSTINLLNILSNSNVRKVIFSSSATVYGDSDIHPILEDFGIEPVSTYGSTKVAIEQMLKDSSRSKKFDVVSLRYFNPVGSHKEMKVYESPYSMPNNLMPRIIRVALKLDQKLQIYGTDYDTRDGTGERDYIHIDDLVEGHFKAVEYIKDFKGYEVFNLGTGTSITVKEIISCFEEVNGIKISHEYADRRPGDIAKCYADPSKANNLLGWSAQKNLEDMCRDAWKAIKNNLNDAK